jgi:cytochrome c oxidase subunit II
MSLFRISIRKLALFLTAIVALLAQGINLALAAKPEPWQLNLQPAASPVAVEMHNFHNLLLVIITLIVLFVLGLLLYVIVRFNAKANPTPSKTTHHTMLEILWTVVPIAILVVIAVPSFKLLYMQDKARAPQMTIKITGHQWYWSYAYPDHGDFAFDAYMIPDDKLQPGQLRLLETDNRVVLPVGKTVRLLITADDVIHSWAMPAFGVKTDAVPGRLNEAWVSIDKPGVYYGQCSEICGVNHAFMPITVEAVSEEDFAKWVEGARQKFAALPPSASDRLLAASFSGEKNSPPLALQKMARLEAVSPKQTLLTP